MTDEIEAMKKADDLVRNRLNRKDVYNYTTDHNDYQISQSQQRYIDRSGPDSLGFVSHHETGMSAFGAITGAPVNPLRTVNQKTYQNILPPDEHLSLADSQEYQPPRSQEQLIYRHQEEDQRLRDQASAQRKENSSSNIQRRMTSKERLALDSSGGQQSQYDNIKKYSPVKRNLFLEKLKESQLRTSQTLK